MTSWWPSTHKYFKELIVTIVIANMLPLMDNLILVGVPIVGIHMQDF
jgi:hypothetical protein